MELNCKLLIQTCSYVDLKSQFNVYFLFQVVKIDISNCSIETPVVYDNVICPITITKYGDPVFSYSGTIDFGDGFIQSISLTNSVVLSHPYLTPGTFSVKISVPALNISSKTLLGDTLIYGKRKAFLGSHSYFELIFNPNRSILT